MTPCFVIPGRPEGPDPESRSSVLCVWGSLAIIGPRFARTRRLAPRNDRVGAPA